MKYAIYIFITLILLGGLFFSESYAGEPKLALSANITGFFDFLGGDKALKARIAELEKENENLKIRIFNNNLAESDTVKVYSIYPFNNVKEIAIAGGSGASQEKGQIVTYGTNILLGKIKVSFKDYSIVETIFDPSFKTEVRVGESEADGLLTGGNVLKLSLLSKKADIKLGDIVITAAKGYPYGLEVGRIKEIKDNLGNPLKDAVLEPIIQLEDLRNVTVHHQLTDYNWYKSGTDFEYFYLWSKAESSASFSDSFVFDK